MFPNFLEITIVSNKRVNNCDVNALVEATLISGPAFIKNTSFDKRVNVLSATLHIANVFEYLSFNAFFKDEIVSAVSPDCEMLTNNVLGNTLIFLYLYSLATSAVQVIVVYSSIQSFATKDA